MDGEQAPVLTIVGKRPADAQTESVIEILTDLLERAREGKILGLASVVYDENKFLTTDISGGASAELLLGGAHCLSYRLLKQIYPEQ